MKGVLPSVAIVGIGGTFLSGKIMPSESETPKTVLMEYDIKVLNDEGNVYRDLALRVYTDKTGDLTENGKKTRITEIPTSTALILQFYAKEDGRKVMYSGVVPFSDPYKVIQGNILDEEKTVVGEWQATVIDKL